VDHASDETLPSSLETYGQVLEKFDFYYEAAIIKYKAQRLLDKRKPLNAYDQKTLRLMCKDDQQSLLKIIQEGIDEMRNDLAKDEKNDAIPSSGNSRIREWATKELNFSLGRLYQMRFISEETCHRLLPKEYELVSDKKKNEAAIEANRDDIAESMKYFKKSQRGSKSDE